MRHHEMSYKKFKLLKCLWVLVAAAVLGVVVMQLWNHLIPDIIPGVHPVTYWQGLGLLLLCRILFGGFRGHRDWHEKREHWQRWQAMTPQERAQLFKSRAFCRPSPPEETKE